MIGLSVRFCIPRMVSGEIDPAKVTKIIGGEMVSSRLIWDEVIAAYKLTDWVKQDPEGCEKLLLQFVDAGKVEQPRLDNKHRYPVHDRENVFVESEDQIVWSE